MSQHPRKLGDFLEEFVDEHAIAGGDELLLDVTPEEAEDLGLFFVRGMCGWMHGLRRVREQQRVVTDAAEDAVEESGEATSEVETELVQ
ncbi:MAG: hypothetical protein M3R15_07840 [Acidobacteriota bacterium]|nr:hypothetical protein [Acidobacteriota bacterium]